MNPSDPQKALFIARLESAFLIGNRRMAQWHRYLTVP